MIIAYFSHTHAHTLCESRQSDSAAKLSKLFAYAELGVNVASKYLTKNYSCFSLSLPLFLFFSSLIQSQNSYALALPIRTIIRPISTNRCTRRKWMRTRIYSTQCSQWLPRITMSVSTEHTKFACTHAHTHTQECVCLQMPLTFLAMCVIRIAYNYFHSLTYSLWNHQRQHWRRFCG